MHIFIRDEATYFIISGGIIGFIFGVFNIGAVILPFGERMIKYLKMNDPEE